MARAMPRSDLRTAGEMLYGPWWESILAHVLEEEMTTLVAWQFDDSLVPGDVWLFLAQELLERGQEIRRLADEKEARRPVQVDPPRRRP